MKFFIFYFLFFIFLLAAEESFAQQKENNVSIYQGKAINENGKPLSGIFPITFSLHKTEKDKKPMWKESFFVAIDNGVFLVELGKINPLPKELKLEEFYIALSLKNKIEILREKFIPQGASKLAALKTNDWEYKTAREASSTSGGEYAKTAGFAAEAEHAKSADTISNMTVDEILSKLKEEAGRDSSSKIKLGLSRRYTNLIGGSGGVIDWSETCPKGYVVVGAKGKSGSYIDSMQFICAPAE